MMILRGLFFFLLFVCFLKAEVEHKKLGEHWDHGSLFKAPTYPKASQFVSDVENTQVEPRETLPDKPALQQHNVRRRSNIRIGPEHKREMTITVRQSLRIL
ncbi:hypothetical protein M3Y97_00002000 [Aphelenchoides bicaudatus]|nr:hypothetical protein M3Y97_00002000 [Aphelenchoides bicaudatus]